MSIRLIVKNFIHDFKYACILEEVVLVK